MTTHLAERDGPERLHHAPIIGPDPGPERWLIMLHGIYGAGRNWASVARRLSRARPGLGALMVDLRGHGESPPMSPPHTVQACAADLSDVVAANGLEAPAVLGHSFGGKVALTYALQTDRPPPSVWVIDSTPDVREPAGSAWEMLEVLRRNPGPFDGRGAAIAALESEGFATPVAQWMSTNVTADHGGAWRWRLDTDQMEDLLVSFFETDAWSVVEDPPKGTHVHFVKASESGILDMEAQARIQAAAMRHGQAHLHIVEGGHWLNADNPDGLHEVLAGEMG
ncbi:MAG: alpha/beta hydrolase [Gemmatimonadetes bacterium]|nr:alpha/beta hydrolase [Gemmatimonadota bacterium]